jgi:hypothetical protein
MIGYNAANKKPEICHRELSGRRDNAFKEEIFSLSPL